MALSFLAFSKAGRLACKNYRGEPVPCFKHEFGDANTFQFANFPDTNSADYFEIFACKNANGDPVPCAKVTHKATNTISDIDYSDKIGYDLDIRIGGDFLDYE